MSDETRIRVHCADCHHEPYISTYFITVELDPTSDTGRLWWQCPNCRTWEDQTLTAQTIELLSELDGITWGTTPPWPSNEHTLSINEYAELLRAEQEIHDATSDAMWTALDHYGATS